MSPVAVGDLFAEEREKLVNYGRAVCGDVGLAEDAVQEVFEDLLRFDIGLRADLTQPTFTWLCKRVRFKIYGVFRRRTIKADVLDETNDVAGAERTEDSAINIIYLDAVRQQRPNLLEDLATMESIVDNGGTRGTRTGRRSDSEYMAVHHRIQRARVRLRESIEQYMIGAYFGGEHHGNDLGEYR